MEGSSAKGRGPVDRRWKRRPGVWEPVLGWEPVVLGCEPAVLGCEPNTGPLTGATPSCCERSSGSPLSRQLLKSSAE